MKIIIMGGGIIGVSSAWYLARAGASVTVIDRQNDVAKETSFANCGQISPGYTTPWPAPGIPFKALKWLFQRDAPLKIHPDGSAFQWQWLLQMLANCNAKSYAVNKSRMLQLAEYSRDQFINIRRELPLSYAERQLGTLQLFRTTKQLQEMYKDLQVLEKYQVPYQALDIAGCIEREPALKTNHHLLTGGLYLPNDETGDCCVFTQKLAEQCKKLGVEFIFNREISHLEQTQQRLNAIYCGDERYSADHYVVALGSFSRNLLRDLGIKLPVYPVKGYSLSIPLSNPESAPRSTILDESYKVAITRLDNQIRVGGMAELSGYQLWLNPRRQEVLEKVVKDWYPTGGNLAQALFWSGLRPMTPDSVPLVGKTPLKNLFLNTGHGTLGWTMSLGSGKYLADIIMEKTPEISGEGLGLQRFN